MRISTTLLLTATTAAVLSGCVGKSEEVDNVSDFGRTKDDNAQVTFSSNSTDLNTLPFYFIGSQTLQAKDVDTIDTNYTKQPAFANFATGSGNTKPFSALNITLNGEIKTTGGVSYYVLTIAATGSYNGRNYATSSQVSGSASSLAQAPTYRIGVAKDVNNTVYIFNATQVEAGLPAVLAPLGNNRLDVFSWATSLDRQVAADKVQTIGLGGTKDTTVNNGLPYLDFTVNVPTSAGNEYAPFTGTAGATKLALANTNTEYHLVRNEFDVDHVAATGGSLFLTSRYGATANVDVSKHIVIPWRPTTSAATVAQLGTVPSGITTLHPGAVFSAGNATRDIKFANAFPGVYWKAGVGFVETLGQIRDDRVTGVSSPLVLSTTAGRYLTETVSKADGTPLVGDYSVSGTNVTYNAKIWTTYVELNANLPRSLVSGYHALPELPYGSN